MTHINLHPVYLQKIKHCIDNVGWITPWELNALENIRHYMEGGGFPSDEQEKLIDKAWFKINNGGTNMLELFFDIETIGCTDPDLIELITEGIKPPSNYSNPDTIVKWEAESKPLLIKEAIEKTSLDGTYGRVCCISFAFGDGEVKSIIDRSEKKVISFFYDEIRAAANTMPVGVPVAPIVIGHNVCDFDLKFMWQRSIINGIKPSVLLPWNEKPWGEHIRDTMILWNNNKDKRISLHKLCIVLGVPSPKNKNGMTGADVAKLWKLRDYNKISEYGKDDVESMRLCYRKMSI